MPRVVQRRQGLARRLRSERDKRPRGTRPRPPRRPRPRPRPGLAQAQGVQGLPHARGRGPRTARRGPGTAAGRIHRPAWRVGQRQVSAAQHPGVGADMHISLGAAVNTFTGLPSDPPVSGRFKALALSDGVCALTGPMMRGLTVHSGPGACLEVDGIHTEQMRPVLVKSSVQFRADFQPDASHVLVAKGAGSMAADPGDLPWKSLPAATRTRPPRASALLVMARTRSSTCRAWRSTRLFMPLSALRGHRKSLRATCSRRGHPTAKTPPPRVDAARKATGRRVSLHQAKNTAARAWRACPKGPGRPGDG